MIDRRTGRSYRAPVGTTTALRMAASRGLRSIAIIGWRHAGCRARLESVLSRPVRRAVGYGLFVNHGFRHDDEMLTVGLIPMHRTVGLHAMLMLSLLTGDSYYPAQVPPGSGYNADIGTGHHIRVRGQQGITLAASPRGPHLWDMVRPAVYLTQLRVVTITVTAGPSVCRSGICRASQPIGGP
jgi:hypothetical protein